MPALNPSLFRAAALLFVALCAGCVVPESQREAQAPSAPSAFPKAHYLRAIGEGVPVYKVNAADSLVVIEVRRSGSLSRLGHDHVVASHHTEGYMAPSERRADLYVPLAGLAVDEPDLRAEAGLDTQPSVAAIEGTRRNMLDKVLEVGQYPYAVVGITLLEESRAPRANVSLALHGMKRSFEVPIQLDQTAEELRASGRLTLSQTDFGIVPFSILAGAIAVQDRLELRFTIRARRVAP